MGLQLVNNDQRNVYKITSVTSMQCRPVCKQVTARVAHRMKFTSGWYTYIHIIDQKTTKTTDGLNHVTLH